MIIWQVGPDLIHYATQVAMIIPVIAYLVQALPTCS
jgi:hypothetical protein